MTTVRGPDGRPRCDWCRDPLLVAYHDAEWGRPVADERLLFEKLSLEAFQAGLNWRLVLARRDALRRAFANFDFRALAQWGEERLAALAADPAIIRHCGKIAAVLSNARIAAELAARPGGFAAFLWRFAPRSAPPGRTSCPEAEALARALKARGWRFIGATSAYAFFQAAGFVNDHHPACALRAEAEAARATFLPPR
ncbi:MAG: hydrolase [Porticoccaceae bacterium]|nr:MAG: hydrolase [Porticoccaceae bacterium]